MRLLPSHVLRAPGRSAKTGPLVPVLAVLVLGGSLYALWELSMGLGPGQHAPLSRSHSGSMGGDSTSGPGPSLPDDTRRTAPAAGSGPRSDPMSGARATFEPAPDGPTLRSQLAIVARSFRTATPDLDALNKLIRHLAMRSEVLTRSIERDPDQVAGRVQLEGTELEARFEIHGSKYLVVMVEDSFETVHPPYLRLELRLSFDTDARRLTETRASLAFIPNPGRRSLDHLGLDEELCVGWEVLFGPAEASAHGIGARVADDLEAWDVGPSGKTRTDKRVRGLSSFQAWRGLLGAALD